MFSKPPRASCQTTYTLPPCAAMARMALLAGRGQRGEARRARTRSATARARRARRGRAVGQRRDRPAGPTRGSRSRRRRDRSAPGTAMPEPGSSATPDSDQARAPLRERELRLLRHRVVDDPRRDGDEAAVAVLADPRARRSSSSGADRLAALADHRALAVEGDVEQVADQARGQVEEERRVALQLREAAGLEAVRQPRVDREAPRVERLGLDDELRAAWRRSGR